VLMVLMLLMVMMAIMVIVVIMVIVMVIVLMLVVNDGIVDNDFSCVFFSLYFCIQDLPMALKDLFKLKNHPLKLLVAKLLLESKCHWLSPGQSVSIKRRE